MKVGIEKINLYAGSLVLDIEKLANARNRDVDFFKNELMIDKKSHNVDYEDVVTMAVNAAKDIVSEQDKNDIELCIFATESGLDYCKSNSTYICKFLGLKPNVRNFEIKNACYAATCAIQMAVSWIKSGEANGKKALVVSSDVNYDHEGRSGEEVPAIGAVAYLISDQPKIIEYEDNKSGYYTFECVDYARPTATYDLINGQESLFAYLECLEGAYEHYKSKVGDIDLKTYFKRFVYHTPFGGLVKRAHDNLLRANCPDLRKKERLLHFAEKVEKSFKLPRVIGNTYSSTLYMGLIGFIMDDGDLNPGDRIGMYSYGSGSTGEFYSVILLPEAKEYIKSLEIEKHLAKRYELDIEEFDHITRTNASHANCKSFKTDIAYPKGWYEEYYKDKRLLVLRGVEDYIREYEWS